MIRFIDLFAGIGGFHYGIEQAHRWLVDKGGQVDSVSARQKTINGTGVGNTFAPESSHGSNQSKPICVYSNEWDKYANSVYRRHYGQCDNADIRTVNAEDIPDFDLLCGGFPCQSFSVAGKRGGFDDTRGTLFFEIARILRAKQPRLCLLENVKGLLSHDNGQTFRTILATLDELGYDLQWQVCNSKDFGVPQNRERVFIVGHLRRTPRPAVFPLEPTSSSIAFNRTVRASGRASYDEKHRWDIVQLNKPTHSNDRLYSDTGISPTLNTMQGGMRQPKITIPVLTPNRAEKRQNGRRFKTDGEPSFTLTGQDIHGVADGVSIRRLTPVECERLQGFPDNWTQLDAEGKTVSDTQRYKMCGNAVTTKVVAEIGKHLW